MVKTDCFAYCEHTIANGNFVSREKGTCGALNALYCENEECKFYKSKKQACAECKFVDCDGCAVKLNKRKM